MRPSPSRSTRWAATGPRARSSRVRWLRPKSSTCGCCCSGVKKRSLPFLPDGHRAGSARGRRLPRHGVDGRRARGRGAAQEGRVGRSLRASRARGPGASDDRARATPAPRWPPRCSASAGFRGSPGRRSPCRCRCPVTTRRSSSMRVPRSTPHPSGSCSSPAWAASTPAPGGTSNEPTIGLLSNGEEEGKGDELRKIVFDLLRKEAGFVGNVEGSDLMQPDRADVVVTDGFTGNVALKSLEGALRSLAGLVVHTSRIHPEEARAASTVVLPLLLDAADAYDPDLTGGAVLLGVKGVCVISHGSSSARAIVDAARVAAECVRVRRRAAVEGDSGRCRLRPTSSSGPLGPDEVLGSDPRAPGRDPRDRRSARSRATPASPTTSVPTRSRSSSWSRRSRRSSASGPSASPSTTRTSSTCAPWATPSTTSSPPGPYRLTDAATCRHG